MQIYSHENKTVTEFGVSNGMFSKIIVGKDFSIAHTTTNTEKFLGWMIEEEVKEETKKEEFQLRMLQIISAWECPKQIECFRGSFNNDHYKKVLAFVSDTSNMVTETFTNTSRIPKVKLKIVYPK